MTLAEAQNACRQASADPRRWCDLGLMHVSLDELSDAAACFARSVELDRRFADGWHNLGTALKRLGRKDAAFDALKTAVLIDPTRADSYLNLGTLLIEADQFEDALICFERAVRHRPDMPLARSRLAR